VLRRLAALVAIGSVALVTTSCQAVTRVTVTEGAAGDGTVSVSLSLDKAAAAQFANLVGQLHLDDLRRAGWTVASPPPRADGSEDVTVTHRFADSKGAEALLAQVGGASGPLHGLQLTRHRSLFTTRTAVSGTVDLRAGADAFADASLDRQLGVPSLSAALAELHQHGSADPGLRLELAAHLPGHLSANAPARSGTAVWAAPLGSTVTVSATATARNWANLGLALLAGLCLLGLLAVGVLRVAFEGRRHRRDDWSIAAAGRRRRPPTAGRRGSSSSRW
jgi:hypothetical protein